MLAHGFRDRLRCWLSVVPTGGAIRAVPPAGGRNSLDLRFSLCADQFRNPAAREPTVE